MRVGDIPLGSILKRPVRGGLGTHHGVVVGPNQVLEVQKNGPSRGLVHLVTVAGFRAGMQLSIEAPPARLDVRSMIERANALLRNGVVRYHALGWSSGANCEHIARGVQRGTFTSDQASFGTLAVIIGGIFVAARLVR